VAVVSADLRLTTTTARGAALVSAVSAALDASVAYHLASPGDTNAGQLGEMYAQTQNTESDVLRLIIDMEGDSVRADRAMATVKRAQDQLDAALTLIKTLLGERDAAVATVRVAEQRRAQAEATRDAAQAVASRAEERARKAEAERDEWRGVAEEGADAVLAARYVAAASWAVAVRNGIDPAAGTGDHDAEPGGNGDR
jgi:hypothetical protein